MLEHLASIGRQGQAGLTWIAIHDRDPAIRNEAGLREAGDLSPVLQHVGLYGYARAALVRIASLPMSRYEELEGLEQLRFLENGLSVYAVPVVAQELPSAGIDTPQDVAKAEAALQRLGDPFRRS